MSSLLAATTAPPSVRRPVFELSFGGSADEWARALATVSVEAGLAPAVDAAEIVLAARDDAPQAKLDATGDVSLGFEDDTTAAVFTGSIRAVHRSVSGKTRVVASNGGALFAGFRLDQGYEQMSAGEIVRELASGAGVAGTFEDGPKLPYYVVDSRSSAWEHVARLAELSGFAAWFGADGALHFGSLESGSPAQTFTYGVDVLELAAMEAAPAAGSVTVVGEGAAGSKGSDAWSWNVKDASPVKGAAGSGDPAVVLPLAALRSAESADAAAKAVAVKAQLGALTARLLVPGAPKATVGSTVAVDAAPDAALNGNWLVRGLRHTLVKSRGYTTLLMVAKEPS